MQPPAGPANGGAPFAQEQKNNVATLNDRYCTSLVFYRAGLARRKAVMAYVRATRANECTPSHCLIAFRKCRKTHSDSKLLLSANAILYSFFMGAGAMVHVLKVVSLHPITSKRPGPLRVSANGQCRIVSNQHSQGSLFSSDAPQIRSVYVLLCPLLSTSHRTSC